jgi:DNA-directed RNA polymerase sigma subunit (sigma70/sigma32)
MNNEKLEQQSMEQDNKDLLKQNLELSDLLEEITNILGFDKIKDLYVHQAKQAREQLDKLKLQPARKDALNAQLRDVIVVAKRMGCYDAADIISSLIKAIEIPKNKS